MLCKYEVLCSFKCIYFGIFNRYLAIRSCSCVYVPLAMKKLCTEKLYANLTLPDVNMLPEAYVLNKIMGTTVVHFLKHRPVTDENMSVSGCMFKFLYYFIFAMNADKHKQEKRCFTSVPTL